MGLRICNNVEAQGAHRQLQTTNQNIGKAMERLSSGLRIKRAGNAAAGLAVSEVMWSKIRGMGVATRNAQDGVSLVQVADAALGTVTDMLQRIRDLAVQAANGTLNDSQRLNLDKEGAIQNRLEQTINRLGVTAENLQAAESRTRTRQLAQPGRDLPLDHPAQGARPQRLRQHRTARADPERVRAPLQPDRAALRMGLHAKRSCRASGAP